MPVIVLPKSCSCKWLGTLSSHPSFGFLSFFFFRFLLESYSLFIHRTPLGAHVPWGRHAKETAVARRNESKPDRAPFASPVLGAVLCVRATAAARFATPMALRSCQNCSQTLYSGMTLYMAHGSAFCSARCRLDAFLDTSTTMPLPKHEPHMPMVASMTRTASFAAPSCATPSGSTGSDTALDTTPL